MCRDELESFALGCQVELLKKNDELLFLQGSTGRYFYIIFQGFVEVYGDNNMHQVAVKLELQKELLAKVSEAGDRDWWSLHMWTLN